MVTEDVPALLAPAASATPSPEASRAPEWRSGLSLARENRRIDACSRANRMDWAYIGGAAGLVVASVYVDGSWIKYGAESPAGRMGGSALVGASWGILLGGTYRAIARCAGGPRGVLSPELAFYNEDSAGWAVSLGAALTAPLVHAIARGPVPLAWSTEERASHVVIPGLVAGLTSWLPAWRPVSPAPWNAYSELIRLDAAADEQSFSLGVRGVF